MHGHLPAFRPNTRRIPELKDASCCDYRPRAHRKWDISVPFLPTRIARFRCAETAVQRPCRSGVRGGVCVVNVKLTMDLAWAASLLGSDRSDYFAGFLQARQGTRGVEQIGRLRGEGWGYPRLPAPAKANVQRGRAFSEPSLFVLKSVLGVAPVAGVKPLRHLRSHRCAPGCDGVEAERVRLSPDWLAGTNRTGQSLALQTKARLPSLSWAVAHAHSQPAYCVQPQPASRTAQPWFSSVPAWEVAIVPLEICGDAGGEIKPPFVALLNAANSSSAS